ncbi:MAG: LysR family transcriptional regulator [Clostridia bacterium]|nr:LysR family transcriptional regulator [Clostridia bacterium]
MEIRDLKYFCVTAELEHVTKAANQLGVAQPFLTRVIRGLESELGVLLFNNIGRSIKLNQYGEALYGMAKKLVNDFDGIYSEMEQVLERYQRNTVFIADSQGYFSDIMMCYRSLYPNNKISVAYCSRNEQIRKLISGEANFALSCPPLPEDPSRGIKTEVVYHEYATVLFPPGHKLLDKTSVTVTDLSSEPMVAPLPGSGVRNCLEAITQKYNFVPNIVCETNDSNLLMKMVTEGVGYSILGRSYVVLNPFLKAYCRPLESEYNNGYFGLSYNTNIFSPNGEEFVSFIQAFFENREKDVQNAIDLPHT